MAELFLLLLFLLLLALAALADLWLQEREDLEQEISRLEQERNRKREKLEQAQVEIDALKPLREELERHGIDAERIEEFIEAQRDRKKDKQEIDELTPLADLGRGVKKAAQDAGVDPRKFLEQTLAERGGLVKNIEDLEATSKNLESGLAQRNRIISDLSGRKGIDPSCWYVTKREGDKEREKVVFLFDIAVHDNHLIVRDRPAPSQFGAEKARLPLERIRFMEPISDQEFLAAMRPIKKMGKTKQIREYSCVFHVLVWDKASPSAKKRWKEATERTIGDVFYRTTVREDPWERR